MKIYKAFAYNHDRDDYCLLPDDDIMVSYFLSKEKCIQRANYYRGHLGGDEAITETFTCSVLHNIVYGISELEVEE